MLYCVCVAENHYYACGFQAVRVWQSTVMGSITVQSWSSSPAWSPSRSWSDMSTLALTTLCPPASMSYTLQEFKCIETVDRTELQSTLNEHLDWVAPRIYFQMIKSWFHSNLKVEMLLSLTVNKGPKNLLGSWTVQSVHCFSLTVLGKKQTENDLQTVIWKSWQHFTPVLVYV